MRLTVFAVLGISLTGLSAGRAGDPKTDPDYVEQQLYDVLRELHNRGADLYDAGDPAGCYRMFQGVLLTARAMLAHRPDDQKFIDSGMAAADKLSTQAMRAHSLHQVIENLRKRIKPAPANDLRAIPPRLAKVEAPKEIQQSKFKPPLDGTGGTVYWQGKPLGDVDLMFVSRGRPDPQVYDTKTNSDGQFAVRQMRPGNYTVLIERMRDGKSLLPERYRSTQTSPLVIEVAGKGEVINLMLQ